MLVPKQIQIFNINNLTIYIFKIFKMYKFFLHRYNDVITSGLIDKYINIYIWYIMLHDPCT